MYFHAAKIHVVVISLSTLAALNIRIAVDGSRRHAYIFFDRIPPNPHVVRIMYNGNKRVMTREGVRDVMRPDFRGMFVCFTRYTEHMVLLGMAVARKVNGRAVRGGSFLQDLTITTKNGWRAHCFSQLVPLPYNDGRPAREERSFTCPICGLPDLVLGRHFCGGKCDGACVYGTLDGRVTVPGDPNPSRPRPNEESVWDRAVAERKGSSFIRSGQDALASVSQRGESSSTLVAADRKEVAAGMTVVAPHTPSSGVRVVYDSGRGSVFHSADSEAAPAANAIMIETRYSFTHEDIVKVNEVWERVAPEIRLDEYWPVVAKWVLAPESPERTAFLRAIRSGTNLGQVGGREGQQIKPGLEKVWNDSMKLALKFAAWWRIAQVGRRADDSNRVNVTIQTIEWFEKLIQRGTPWWCRAYWYYQPYMLDPVRRRHGFVDCHVIPEGTPLGDGANEHAKRFAEVWIPELESMGIHNRTIPNEEIEELIEGGLRRETRWSSMCRRIACHVFQKPDSWQGWKELCNEFRHGSGSQDWGAVTWGQKQRVRRENIKAIVYAELAKIDPDWAHEFIQEARASSTHGQSKYNQRFDASNSETIRGGVGPGALSWTVKAKAVPVVDGTDTSDLPADAFRRSIATFTDEVAQAGLVVPNNEFVSLVGEVLWRTLRDVSSDSSIFQIICQARHCDVSIQIDRRDRTLKFDLLHRRVMSTFKRGFIRQDFVGKSTAQVSQILGKPGLVQFVPLKISTKARTPALNITRQGQAFSFKAMIVRARDVRRFSIHHAPPNSRELTITSVTSFPPISDVDDNTTIDFEVADGTRIASYDNKVYQVSRTISTIMEVDDGEDEEIIQVASATGELDTNAHAPVGGRIDEEPGIRTHSNDRLAESIRPESFVPTVGARRELFSPPEEGNVRIVDDYRDYVAPDEHGVPEASIMRAPRGPDEAAGASNDDAILSTGRHGRVRAPRAMKLTRLDVHAADFTDDDDWTDALEGVRPTDADDEWNQVEDLDVQDQELEAAAADGGTNMWEQRQAWNIAQRRHGADGAAGVPGMVRRYHDQDVEMS